MTFCVYWATRLLLIVAIGGGNVVMAAEMFSKGDMVEVNHKNEWRLGTVESVNAQGLVTVTFNPAGKEVKNAFKAESVRTAEPLTGQTSRTWTDSTGTMKLPAELIGIGKLDVALRKPDMTVVIVGVDKLSQVDRLMVQSAQKLQELKKAAAVKPNPNPVPGGEPPMEKPVEIAGNQEIVTFQPLASQPVASGVPVDAVLTPDPLPATLKMAEGGVTFEVEPIREHVQALLPLGGSERYLLAATDQRTSAGKPTRLLWCALTSKKVVGEQLLPCGEVVADYDTATHRLLTYTDRTLNRDLLKEKGIILSVWEVLPTEKVVKAVARWRVDQEFLSRDQEWARFANGNLVLHRDKRAQITAWDVTQKGATYALAISTKSPRFSPGRKYLLVPLNGGLGVFDPTSGQALATFPAAAVNAFGVSDDGKRLAIAESQQLSVWDFAKPTKAVKEHRLPPRVGNQTARLAFLGERIAVLSSSVVGLYSTARDMPLWEYNLALSGFDEHSLIDGRLFYAAAAEGALSKQMIVGAVKLPGPGVDAAEGTLKYVEPPTYLQRGSTVKLEVQTGEFDLQVRAALEKKIADNGWKLAEQAEYVVRASMQIGELKTMEYEDRLRLKREKVTLRTFDADVTIGNKEKSVWTLRGGFHGLPNEIRLDKNETIADWVKKRGSDKIDARFFESVTIPETIKAEPITRPAGVSRVGPRGLVAN